MIKTPTKRTPNSWKLQHELLLCDLETPSFNFENRGLEAKLNALSLSNTFLLLVLSKSNKRFGCTAATSTPKLPFKTPQIPSNGDHKAAQGR